MFWSLKLFTGLFSDFRIGKLFTTNCLPLLDFAKPRGEKFTINNGSKRTNQNKHNYGTKLYNSLQKYGITGHGDRTVRSVLWETKKKLTFDRRLFIILALSNIPLKNVWYCCTNWHIIFQIMCVNKQKKKETNILVLHLSFTSAWIFGFSISPKTNNILHGFVFCASFFTIWHVHLPS